MDQNWNRKYSIVLEQPISKPGCACSAITLLTTVERKRKILSSAHCCVVVCQACSAYKRDNYTYYLLCTLRIRCVVVHKWSKDLSKILTENFHIAFSPYIVLTPDHYHIALYIWNLHCNQLAVAFIRYCIRIADVPHTLCWNIVCQTIFQYLFFNDMSTTGLELISELLRLTHRLQKFDAIH